MIKIFTGEGDRSDVNLYKPTNLLFQLFYENLFNAPILHLHT